MSGLVSGRYFSLASLASCGSMMGKALRSRKPVIKICIHNSALVVMCGDPVRLETSAPPTPFCLHAPYAF